MRRRKKIGPTKTSTYLEENPDNFLQKQQSALVALQQQRTNIVVAKCGSDIRPVRKPCQTNFFEAYFRITKVP